jgi:hypothetical protein
MTVAQLVKKFPEIYGTVGTWTDSKFWLPLLLWFRPTFCFHLSLPTHNSGDIQPSLILETVTFVLYT